MPLSKIQTVDNQVIPNLGRRNLIINGAMQVAQRATSASVSNSVTYLTLDRWQYTYGHNSSNAYSTWTMSQDSDAPSGFANSIKFICTTAASAPTTLTGTLIQQKFEGQDLQQLQFATSGAKVLTASFYVKSNQTGNIGVQLFAEDDQTMNSQLISIDTANTWEFKTVTFAAKTSGTQIPDDNTLGLRIRFVFEYNTGRAFGTANTWATKQTNSQLVPAGTSARTSSVNDTFFITGCQLEVGDTATDFEHRSFEEELRLCSRYYRKIGRHMGGGREGYSSSAVTFYPGMRLIGNDAANIVTTLSAGGVMYSRGGVNNSTGTLNGTVGISTGATNQAFTASFSHNGASTGSTYNGTGSGFYVDGLTFDAEL